ncbi:Uncharacterized protein Fot_03140 [Forsythia ovata]|uniref:Uncharacterized protein n=1 Tax=Forsythia ovata TaxID=205694 RepID=A0ABD1X8V1_9LAMI
MNRSVYPPTPSGGPSSQAASSGRPLLHSFLRFVMSRVREQQALTLALTAGLAFNFNGLPTKNQKKGSFNSPWSRRKRLSEMVHEQCGLLVAIALADMHECEIKKHCRKKLKSQFGIGNSNEQKIQYQPRSAFRFFIASESKAAHRSNRVPTMHFLGRESGTA